MPEPLIRPKERRPREPKQGLRLPQIRVLAALAASRGPLTRGRLSSLIGNKTGVVVGRAIGYADAQKRAVFEQTKDGGGEPGKPCPSLLTLGYVEPIELDIDGLLETTYTLTAAGRKAYSDLGELELPPLRD